MAPNFFRVTASVNREVWSLSLWLNGAPPRLQDPPSYNSALQKMSASDQHPPILRTTDCMAEFVVDPGNDGRIKIILSSGIDLDPGARVQEMILVATIDRPKESGAAMIALLPRSQLIADPNNNQRFTRLLQVNFPGTQCLL